MAHAGASSAVTLRAATPDLLPACLALLPSMAVDEAVVLVAQDADGTLAGAGAVRWRGWERPSGMPAWLHVLPDRRRAGVGRALLAALSALARERTEYLLSSGGIVEGDEASMFARACGATLERQQLFFEADAPPFIVQMDDIVGRLERHGHMPAEIETGTLRADDLATVKWLVAEGLESPPPWIDAVLAAAMDPATPDTAIDRDGSVVLRRAGEVVGALLSRRAGAGTTHVMCNVVAPSERRGWANALLVRTFTRRAIEAGYHRVGFDCSDRVRDTIGLARRAKADLVRSESVYRYAANAT